MKYVTDRSQARALGLRRYFPRVPCKHGHVGERYVANNQCCECRRGWEAEFYSKNRERLLEKQKRRGKRCSGKGYEYTKKYRERHPERVREIQRMCWERYKLNGGEKLKAKRRAMERESRAKKAAAYRALVELGIEF